MTVLRLHVLVLHPDEGPLAPVDGNGWAVGKIADRQGGLCLLRVGGRIGKVLPVSQEEHVRRLVGLELAHDPAGQRPLGTDGLRSLQSDEPGSGRNVGLPAAPNDGVAPAHEVAVASL